VVERFVVLLTDGTHEAGNEQVLRPQALATVYTLGIKGAYDACRLEELAGRGGACTGPRLKWCSNNSVQWIECDGSSAEHMPNCGWDSTYKVYNCGTTGGSDPSGLIPKACLELPR